MENVKKWWAPILMITFGVIGLALGLTAVIKELVYAMEWTNPVTGAVEMRYAAYTPNEMFNQIEQWSLSEGTMVDTMIAHTNMMFLGGIAALVIGLGSTIVGIVFAIKTKNDNVSNAKVMYGLVILPVAALAVGIGAIICNADLGSESWWNELWKEGLAKSS